MKRTYPALDLMAGVPVALLLSAGCGTGTDTAAPSCDTTQWMNVMSITEPIPEDIVALVQCEHEPDLSPEGEPACVVLEARVDGACGCDASETRVPVAAEHQSALAFAMASAEAQQHGWDCYCEVPALEDEQRAACQVTEPPIDGEPLDGWCYIDATTSPPIGDPEMVSPCPSDKQRGIKLLGEGRPWSNRSAVIVCQRETCSEESPH